jgi:hypothetical protein
MVMGSVCRIALSQRPHSIAARRKNAIGQICPRGGAGELNRADQGCIDGYRHGLGILRIRWQG